MNNKGFTLMELLAVIVILSILSLIAVPTMMQQPEMVKKKTYVTNAKSFITAASYLYTLDQYNKDENYFIKDGDSYTITLDKLTEINSEKDPYGFSYDLKNSYITFSISTDENNRSKRITTIYIKSCNLDKTKCHCIKGNSEELSEDLVDASCLNEQE